MSQAAVPVNNPFGQAQDSANAVTQNQQFASNQAFQGTQAQLDRDQQLALTHLNIEAQAQQQIRAHQAQIKAIQASSEAQKQQMALGAQLEQPLQQEREEAEQARVETQTGSAEKIAAQELQSRQIMFQLANQRADHLIELQKEMEMRRTKAIQDQMAGLMGPEATNTDQDIIGLNHRYEDLKLQQTSLTNGISAADANFHTMLGTVSQNMNQLANTIGERATKVREQTGGSLAQVTALGSVLNPRFFDKDPDVMESYSPLDVVTGPDAWPGSVRHHQEALNNTSAKFVEKLGETIGHNLEQNTGAYGQAQKVMSLVKLMHGAMTVPDSDGQLRAQTAGQARALAQDIVNSSDGKIDPYTLREAVLGGLSDFVNSKPSRNTVNMMEFARTLPTGIPDWLLDVTGNKEKMKRVQWADDRLTEAADRARKAGGAVFGNDWVDSPETVKSHMAMVLNQVAQRKGDVTPDVKMLIEHDAILSHVLAKKYIDLDSLDWSGKSLDEKKAALAALTPQIREIRKAQMGLEARKRAIMRQQILNLPPDAGISPADIQAIMGTPTQVGAGGNNPFGGGGE